MNDACLMNGYHTLYDLRKYLEISFSVDTWPVEQVISDALTRAILCLDHQIKRHVRLLLFDKVLQSVYRDEAAIIDLGNSLMISSQNI